MKLSPLDARHREAGAKMVPFGGWEMPVAYGDGTLAEHRRCRSDAVVFDVSHLGTVRVRGSGAFAALQAAFTNDLAKIGSGRAQYTHLLDADGSVLDDIIVWWREEHLFDVMPNASNTERVVAALSLGAPDVAVEDVTVEDVTGGRVILAVQGPRARARLSGLGAFDRVGRFRVASLEVAGIGCVVAGTGYTGEDGVEIAVAAEHAPMLWDAVLAAGVSPAGLGARDTLRLEAGLPLHGHELGAGISPLQAGLGWVVSFDKGDFPGREALVNERKRGPARLLRGLRFAGRQPGRDGAVVSDAEGSTIGVVTSGNFSPMLECGIAMAFLDPSIPIGTPVLVDVRGRHIGAELCALPFYRAGS